MKKKLRIGILLNHEMIPAWSYKMIEQINNSYHSEIVLLVKNNSTNCDPKRNLFADVIAKFRTLFYKIYIKLDNKLFSPHHNAFSTKNINKILSTKIINVTPHKTKFKDIINDEDILKIRNENIDIFIRMGFRILSGDILKVAKYGIWSYHHGDNSVIRGGPAGFWEILEKWKETGVTLQILSEDLDNGQILFKSFSKTINHSLILNKNNFYWKSLSFIPNKMKELFDLGDVEFFNEINEYNSNPLFYSNKLYQEKNIRNAKIIYLILNNLYNFMRNRISRIFYLKQWILLFKINESNSISKTFFRFKKIVPPIDRFWADPFVIEKEDKYYIFIEELMYDTNKGHISYITMDKKGNYTKPIKIIEKKYHLSYPFLIEDGGNLYMIPETKENKTIDLYKCSYFPNEWKYEKTLINNIEAVDTTIIHKNEKYWMFTNIANKGASNLEELYVFSADNLHSNNWIPHPKNPVVSDVKQSRPAGNFFTYNGNLYRPSQNNTVTYGYGMKINKVLCLDEFNYNEEVVNSIYPNWDANIIATHTFNHEEKLTIIDGLFKRKRNFYQIIKLISSKMKKNNYK